jgi:hypothetical protein
MIDIPWLAEADGAGFHDLGIAIAGPMLQRFVY